MKYINTPKDMNFKLCPLCKVETTYKERAACKTCENAYEAQEKNLDFEEWVILNKWCRRLPFFADYFIKLKIWKLYDIDTYGKPFAIFVVVMAILFFVACVAGGIVACIGMLS